jgi:hypothetical protein
VFSQPAFAWGKEGHETVGYIAASLIAGTKAEAHVRALLKPNETLATAAEWPDCAKGYCGRLTKEMTEFNHDNLKNHSYHYTDVPFQLPKYDLNAIGTTPDDVVHILRDAISVLQDKPPIDPSHKLTQREALFILAHMVGDIHQPLHVGAAYVSNLKYIVPKTQDEAKQTFSEGGNWLCVGSKGLHSLWDGEYVKVAMKDAGAETSKDFAAKLVAAENVAHSTGSAIQWPSQWATESLHLADDELADISIIKKRAQGPKGSCSRPRADKPSSGNMWTVELPAGYADHAVQDVVPAQLRKAGVRLAELLKAIWP